MPDLNDALLNGAGRPIRSRGARIVAYYSLFASIWILFSDELLGLLVSDPHLMTKIAMLKGWFFVAITSLLLFFLIRRMLDNIDDAQACREKAMSAIADDIAKRKRVEEALKENAHFLQILIDAIPNPIFYKDIHCVYQGCNSAFEVYLGRDKSSIVGSSAYDLAPKKLADHYYEMDAALMNQGGVQAYESSVKYADGTLHDVIFNKATYTNADGTLGGIVGVILDITERKKAEEELIQYRDQLENIVEERTAQLEVAIENLSVARDEANAANQAKSMFLANMSHEIRTPMNAVLGFAQLLERDPLLSPQARNKVATIMKSGEHLLAIINDILEMSRIEAGRVEVRTQSVDLHNLLDDLTVMFRLRAEEKELAFNLDAAPDLPRYIVADLSKLRQVLINLLGNAVKFTRLGSIVLHAFPASIDRIAIEVQDSGIGITQEEQEKLFRPFERTRSGEHAGGTGLGLAISREYAHLMSGDITVVSQAGSGSCFRFEFRGPATLIIPSSPAPSRRVTGLAPGQEKIRILIVDDQSANRQLLREMLEPFGFAVDEACDGDECITKVHALTPRVILMDLVMPGMDGVETTRILRSTRAKEALAIIGITASAFEKEKQQFLDSGLNAFIAKPFREQELYDVLAGHAGVLFETEGHEEVTEHRPSQEVPSFNKMSVEWCESFREALNRKNITRIRKLGEKAKECDPLLSSWLLERVSRYDLDGLKKTCS